MAGILIQFHATQEELLSFTGHCVRELGVQVTAIQYHPFAAMRVEPTALGDAFVNSAIRRLAFTRSPPVLGAEVLTQFIDHNPDVLMLDIGRLSVAGLKESCLTARTTGPEELQTWKKIAARLKKVTSVGAIAIDPQTGAASKLRAHRCTPGAKALQVQGVPMLPVAGSAVIRYLD